MSETTQNFRGNAAWLVFVVTSVALVLAMLWMGRVVFFLLFAAIIGAVLLTAVGHWLGRRLRLSMGLSLMAFLFALALTVGILVWAQGPNFVEQFQQLGTQLPQAFSHLLLQMNNHSWGKWLLSQTPDTTQVSNGISFAFSRIGGIVLSSATILAGVLIVLILSLYFAVEPLIYYHGLRRLFPARTHVVVDACAHAITQSLRWWVLAKLISMSMVGILVSVGLALIGVPLAGSLGLIAAALTFIPNVGPLIAFVPAEILALAISPLTGLLAVGVFGIVFTLEGYIVTPLLERNIVRLPPALTLTLQLLLAAIAGPVGVALAAPLAAAGIAIGSILLKRQKQEGPPAGEP